MRKGIKHDSGKPRIDLASRVALEGLGTVLGFGSKEYAVDNWRAGMDWRRLIGAAYRHLGAFQDGEDFDLKSGLPHIDHLACCVMFLSEYQKLGIGRDDRYKRSINIKQNKSKLKRKKK